ncbi:hypothetical protein M231_06081 [Tremella mesenterica]|uniref:Uncharacterized protein n=2 Tax=Tremella mesenterica TaxID=5217 RepID=A0A4Q1BGK8_TREME|nr:hypothetical protein M231_06081 [Tremella mesenterica]
MAEAENPLSSEQVSTLLSDVQVSAQATSSALRPLMEKVKTNDSSLDMSSGLSLLLLRPHLLLSSLHHLVILLALRIQGIEPSSGLYAETSFASSSRSPLVIDKPEDAMREIIRELSVNREVMDKIKGLEGKLEYQIKKLSALAEAEEVRGQAIVEEVEDDPLSFRPYTSAMLSSVAKDSTRDADDDGPSAVYRPPRVAAVPYTESTKSRRTERRAPALLSEFAATMNGAPLLQSTSGLATRPVQAQSHSNSTSAKRAAELARMNQFEEENMTRLVTSKREAKRRREDEEALALGYGVGGPARSRGRRQNGLEAELEGVLGERGSKGLWESVSSGIGKRGGVLDRAKKGGVKESEGGRRKKARFEKDVAGHGKKRL